MLTHIWSMSFTDTATAEQRSAFNAAMAEWPTKIDGVESLRSGTDLRLNPGNSDVAIVAQFADASAWRVHRGARPRQLRRGARHAAVRVVGRYSVRHHRSDIAGTEHVKASDPVLRCRPLSTTPIKRPGLTRPGPTPRAGAYHASATDHI